MMGRGNVPSIFLKVDLLKEGRGCDGGGWESEEQRCVFDNVVCLEAEAPANKQRSAGLKSAPALGEFVASIISSDTNEAVEDGRRGRGGGRPCHSCLCASEMRGSRGWGGGGLSASKTLLSPQSQLRGPERRTD